MLMCSLVDKEAEREMQEELADYNGDDENEGEFEADKQAELAQFWGNTYTVCFSEINI